MMENDALAARLKEILDVLAAAKSAFVFDKDQVNYPMICEVFNLIMEAEGLLVHLTDDDLGFDISADRLR